MSAALANPSEMIRQGAPRLIHSDEELARYTQELFALTSKSERTPEEEEAIGLLTLLIEHYEAERHPIPEAGPVDVLRFLLEHNGLAQRDIVSELGSESTVSLVLAGNRQLTRQHWIGQRLHGSQHAGGLVPCQMQNITLLIQAGQVADQRLTLV